MKILCCRDYYSLDLEERRRKRRITVQKYCQVFCQVYCQMYFEE
jgi:hypothetical protein